MTRPAQPPPECPHCRVPVYMGKTHHCPYRVGLPNPPAPVVPMPATFRSQVARARLALAVEPTLAPCCHDWPLCEHTLELEEQADRATTHVYGDPAGRRRYRSALGGDAGL